MAFKRNKTIKILKDWVKKLNKSITVTHAYLFGSYAKGHATRWSDIDLAVVSPDFKGIRFYDCKTLIPFLEGMPSSLEIHPFRKKEFDAKNLFVQEIIKSGIRIK